MTTQFPIALSSSVDLENLTWAERKKLPFYIVTADPFGAVDKWNSLSQDSSFMSAFHSVMDLNNSAIRQNESQSGWNHVHYWFERPDKPIRLHWANISVIALILSLESTIRAQSNISSMLWFITSMDLSNLRELFETVNQQKPRTYHSNIVQMLHWFYQVRYQFYEFDVKTTREEEFRDFERIGGSPDGIRERIKYLHNGKMYLKVARDLEFVFDFVNATTELVINHWNYRKSKILAAIQKNNPFANQERVNILFPLGTAGWTVPLINLVKITFETWNWREKEKLVFTKNSHSQIQSNTQESVQRFLESE